MALLTPSSLVFGCDLWEYRNGLYILSEFRQGAVLNKLRVAEPNPLFDQRQRIPDATPSPRMAWEECLTFASAAPADPLHLSAEPAFPEDAHPKPHPSPYCVDRPRGPPL